MVKPPLTRRFSFARRAAIGSAPLVLGVGLLAGTTAAFIVLVDGARTVILGALRSAGDVLLPTLIYVVAFRGLTIPPAYLFGLSGNAGVARRLVRPV